MKRPYVATPQGKLYKGDALEILRESPEKSVRCCVTKPPRWKPGGGKKKELGRERTPEEYVERLAEVFREVHRVVKDDGLLWICLEDSLASEEPVGLPWKIIDALRSGDWKLKREVVWDRGPRPHKNIFLMFKQREYYLDPKPLKKLDSVWTFPPLKRKEAHLNDFPPDLVRPCVLAGSKPKDYILDPFFGVGTVGKVAGEHGRNWIGIEINSRYCRYVAKKVAVEPQLVIEDFLDN